MIADADCIYAMPSIETALSFVKFSHAPSRFLQYPAVLPAFLRSDGDTKCLAICRKNFRNVNSIGATLAERIVRKKPCLDEKTVEVGLVQPRLHKHSASLLWYGTMRAKQPVHKQNPMPNKNLAAASTYRISTGVLPFSEIWTEITEVGIPQPEPDDVAIKVIVAESNVKDWLHLKASKKTLNSGDDVAGVVHSIGTNAQTMNEYSPGDRIAAFRPMMEPHGAYAEYAVVPIHTVMKLPDAIAFEGSVECHHDLDAISSNGTWIPISHMLAPSSSLQSPSYLSVVTGPNKYDEDSIQTGIEVVYTMVGTAHTGSYKPGMVKQPSDKEFVKGDPEWVAVFFKYMSQMLVDGRLTGHPFEVINRGLIRVGEGLKRFKYVYNKVGELE
ncbi:hypothetical protein BHYA_0041g00540 [Botrytis hyacinthi]|uniref:Alcohol dehydrogenase-like N-terminal domain-containing protein n=1 Tax=Botrytis hyacinthi TaxID=278943 RepID=A0A4Z1H4H7_9HELO|nr:hypothetical protein BHYA_0041g00540 [Botrytis hyacinthi]